MTNNTSTTHGSIHPGRRRMRRRPILVLAAGSAAACGLLAGCGAAGGTAGAATQGSGQSITLFSGQHEQTTNGLVTAFEKQTGSRSTCATTTRTPWPT
jgi:spermidine/putrescine-binding protein